MPNASLRYSLKQDFDQLSAKKGRMAMSGSLIPVAYLEHHAQV
jgi:hypothetical protein